MIRWLRLSLFRYNNLDGQRPYAVRKPREYVAKEPGDIVESDTLAVRPMPSVVLKHFTARDIISRWDVLEAHTRATSHTACSFIDSLLRRMPFPIRAIQVDGGSEFEDAFEKECQRRGIRLFVLPPRSPKLNPSQKDVERAHRTHTEGFYYEVYHGEMAVQPLNRTLEEWEAVYNTVQPHQAIDSLTPAEYIRQHHPELAPRAISVLYVLNEYKILKGCPRCAVMPGGA